MSFLHKHPAIGYKTVKGNEHKNEIIKRKRKH